MLDKLKEKWGVSGWQFVLILCTFAIGGSLSGFLAKKVMALLAWEKSTLWWIVYVTVVTLLWPLCVLSISILFGQFAFFKSYLAKMARRMKLMK